MSDREKYTAEAIERAREGALDWLLGNGDGYPRSWEQEAANDRLRSLHPLYEYDWEAPPIAGYEALELEGLVLRVGAVNTAGGEERIHFKLKRPSDA